MKRILKLLLLLVLFTKVYAYENEYFTIEIPEEYTLEENDEENNYRWVKENNYVSITVSDNKKLKYDVEKYTDEDIAKEKEYLESGINTGLLKYNIKVDVSDIKKLNDEDNYYLEYDIYYPSKDITGYNMYQKGRMYTTNNYITTFIYSSDKEVENNEEYLGIINSLKIKDTKVVRRNYKIYLIAGFVAILSIGILVYIRAIKKRS